MTKGKIHIIKYQKQLVIGISVILLLLSFINFIYNRSIWLDEAFLALNIRELDINKLLQPLKYGQVAPIGYLIFERLMVMIFGFHDWVLRLYSYVTFIAASYLFYKIILKLFDNNFFAWFSLAIFLSFKPILYYSTEIKPYMGDLFWGLLLLYFYIEFINDTKKSKYFYTLAVLGMIAIWFSTVSLIIMASIFIHYIFFVIVIKKIKLNTFRKYDKLLILILGWGGMFSIYSFLFLIHNPEKKHMLKYWQQHFMPLDIFNPKILDFLYNEMKYFFSNLSNLPHWHFYIFFLISGLIFFMTRKKYKTLMLILLPIILHLSISAFKLYPFSGRLILYLFPFFTILISYGLYMFYKKLLNKNFIILGFILISFPFLESFLVLKKQFPFQRQEIKVALEHLNKKLKPNQQVYIYYASKYAFDVYKYSNRYPKMISSQIIYGNRINNSNRNFNLDVAKLKRDIWLIFTHIGYDNEGVSDMDKILVLLTKNNNFKTVEKIKFAGDYLIHLKK